MPTERNEKLNDKWTVRGGRVVSLAPFTIAGIVNVTPDSFSDGGLYYDHEKALARCLELLAQGARILDIGGESTRPAPDSLPIGEAEEQRRILPVLRQLAELRAKLGGGQKGSTGCHEGMGIKHSGCADAAAFPCHANAAPHSAQAGGSGDSAAPFPYNAPYAEELQRVEPAQALLSVDTWRAGTAVAALEAGADIINDIAGTVFDPLMVEVLASYKPGYILGHCPEPPAVMQNAPHYDDVVEELYAHFATQAEMLVKRGLPENRIMLDPCFGFGKNLTHNLDLMRGLGRILELGFPVCMALSRKTLIGNLLGLPIGPCRDMPTQVFSALLLERGGLLHRVHDVDGCWKALRLAVAVNL